MTTATISFARNNLSALLRKVRRGEDILILDRKQPVARLSGIDTRTAGWDARMADLARRGIVRPPSKAFDLKTFRRMPLAKARRGADIVAALVADREQSG
jgi:prevent-host-death family protein